MEEVQDPVQQVLTLLSTDMVEVQNDIDQMACEVADILDDTREVVLVQGLT